MAAARAGSSQISPSRGRAGSSTTVVTVDRLLSGRTGCTRPGQIFQPIHRRSVYRYETGNVRGLPSIASSSQSPVSPPPPTRPQSQGTLSVLVIDPLASTSGEAGLAAVSAGSIVEGAGCRVAVMSFSLDDQLVLAVDGAPLDLVVLVLDGCRLGRPRRQASGAWGVPGRLTASYIAAGIPVVAVDAGAGAAMLASCVARGAPALFSLDRLPDALASLQTFPDGELLAASETSLSPRFAALVGLTASERRVLFYLTEGWAAQDIADELVVSLTTVRSHIRSVLRKLGVKSQLAAVAIANSRDLEDDASGEAS
jgi:DNA-binding CsgD family transcriptional regulator